MCDIVGIYNGNGDLTAKYTYDSWGNVTSITDGNGNAITDQNHIGNLNPFRYRGYYMDTETGMYYLMSRYYDPVTHRFLNADGYFQTGLGILDGNMNAYCGNDPINFFDPTGTVKSNVIQHDLLYNDNSKFSLQDAINAQKSEMFNQNFGINVSYGEYMTDYYGPAWSPIKIYHGYGYSNSSSTDGGKAPIALNYTCFNNDWTDATMSLSADAGFLSGKGNLGLNNYGYAIGGKIGCTEGYLSKSYSLKEFNSKIGWDSATTIDGYTTYDDWGVCIDYKSLALCAAIALPAVLIGGASSPAYAALAFL